MSNIVSTGFIKGLLSWFQHLVNSIISLISGSEGGSLISFLARYWKGILVILFVIGCSVNLIVYLIRWRPQWWWFAKKRMIIDDSILEPRAKKKNAVKPSTIVPIRKNTAKKPKPADLFDTDDDDLMVTKKRK